VTLSITREYRTPDPAMVFVAHDCVPGRVRLRAAALKSRPVLGPLVEAALQARPGVSQVRVNPLTGSVLVRFDAERVTTEQLRRWIDRSLNGAGGRRERANRGGQGQLLPSSVPPSPRPPVAPSPLEAVHHWASRSVEEAYRELASSSTGLAPGIALQRRATDGPNQLPEVKPRSSVQILRDQLVSLPTLMLVVAVGLSVATGGLVDAAVIASVLVLNGAIGFGTEQYAEGTIRALQRLASRRAAVLREGQPLDIPSQEVVVGDVVRLRQGDLVPADGRVVEANALTADEALLTGESVPVPKVTHSLPAPASIGECHNLVFLGTAVATGRGCALVTATGQNTQVGQITALVGQERAPRTRMQQGLDDLARRLGLGTLAVCGGLFAFGLGFGLPALEMLQTAVALAISAVPEGLPAVATCALAIGMARMLKRQVVIRKLPAVEALGGVTVLCVDKTGTLTLNQMQLVEVHVDGRLQPFRPAETWAVGRLPIATPAPMSGMEETQRRLLEVGALCNEADLEISTTGPHKDDRTGLRIRGSATEGALLLAAQNGGIDTAVLRAAYPLIDIRHREMGSPMMLSLHEQPAAGGRELDEAGRAKPGGRSRATRLCAKGASETVLALCTHVLIDEQRVRLTPALRRQILAANEEMAARGLRVLGFAERQELGARGRGSARPSQHADRPEGTPAVTPAPLPLTPEAGGLTWLGMSGMEDPLRPEAAASIDRCRAAGIRTVILTGDQPATARAVARALGIGQESHEEVAEASALLGLSPPQIQETAARTHVYARVSPEDKLRIVRALQANGEVVAMTGDGVNDGPAMKAADVSIAMGGQGTEIAREIADMVLLEDDFNQLMHAIEQGRALSTNIVRALRFLIASNLSEVIGVGAALVTRTPIPLSAFQMLWMNLISDVFPALALTLDPPAAHAMRQPPRPPDEPLISAGERRIIGQDALLLAASTFALHRWARWRHGGEELPARTMAFTASCLAEIFYALACGSPLVRREDRPRLSPNGPLLATVVGTAALQISMLHFPALRRLLQLTPLEPRDWLGVLAGAVLPATLVATRQHLLPSVRPQPPMPTTDRGRRS
jgi:P-type Ca2+ transporter type 2C